MTKPGPKELQNRANGQARHSNGRFAGGKAQGVPAVSKQALAGKLLDTGSCGSGAMDDALRPLIDKTLELVERHNPGFDRRAYQRVYCKLHRRHGPISGWPESALAELRTVSRGRPL